MSDFILEINEPAPNLLSIETSFMEEVVDTIDIQFVDTVNVDIVNTEKFLVTDLPDNIPFTKIVGNIDVSRINNLNSFVSGYLQSNFTVNVDELIWNNNQVGLDGYLDQYNFDGGTP
jgi:hypothetical protein